MICLLDVANMRSVKDIWTLRKELFLRKFHNPLVTFCLKVQVENVLNLVQIISRQLLLLIA